MQDFHAHEVEKKERLLGEIGNLAYKRFAHCKAIEHAEAEIKEIDIGIAEREAIVSSLDQVLRDFNAYLTVKEGAIDMDDLGNIIRAGGDGSAESTGASDGAAV